jgi:hypothetical protein
MGNKTKSRVTKKGFFVYTSIKINKMKKVLTTAIVLITISMALTSCTKEPETSKTVFARWHGRFRNCNIAHRGTCSSLTESTDGKLESIKLDVDEAVGTVLTKKLGNGNLVTSITLTKLNLSASLLDGMLKDKVILNDGECLIPANLMNASLAAAGLPDKVVEPIVIPKGNMPLTLEKQNMQSISSILIELTTSAKHDYIGHVTLLR